ncbi:MAG TPA: hypothetical protein VFU69_00520 [Ktedonobacterales bacterium]|nr:hypothetical protein [Ktedonobacterales bacterium]
MKKVYGLWLLAFSLKLFGSGWDTSWHFKYFFDTFSPPHNINTVGFILAWALIVYHWGGTEQARRWVKRLPASLQAFTHRWVLAERLGTERYMDTASLWIATSGMLLFLIAAPLDQMWHRVFGLDLTTWSPTHLALFGGTELAILGVLLGLYRQGGTNQRGSFASVALLLFGGFLLEAFLFATGQQEYGYIALYALQHPSYVTIQHMTTFPIPALLAQAQSQGGAQALATGQVPTWIYPLYQLLVVCAVLQLMQRLHRRFWTATDVVALYLTYRLLARFLLHSFDFPVSFVPYYLLGIGLSLDIFGALARWRARPPAEPSASARTGIQWSDILWGGLAAIGATAAVYAGAALIQQFEVTPPVPLGSAQFGFLDGGFPLGFLMACLGLWLAQRSAALFEAQRALAEKAALVQTPAGIPSARH